MSISDSIITSVREYINELTDGVERSQELANKIIKVSGERLSDSDYDANIKEMERLYNELKSRQSDMERWADELKGLQETLEEAKRVLAIAHQKSTN